jgi:hypothetical protein
VEFVKLHKVLYMEAQNYARRMITSNSGIAMQVYRKDHRGPSCLMAWIPFNSLKG